MRKNSVLRKIKIYAATFSALCIATVLLAGTVFLQAAEEETTYTVRIFAGDTGKITSAADSNNGVADPDHGISGQFLRPADGNVRDFHQTISIKNLQKDICCIDNNQQNSKNFK